jgi:hypothetical protein
MKNTFEIIVTAESKAKYINNKTMINEFEMIKERFNYLGVNINKFLIEITDENNIKWIAKDFDQALPSLEQLNETNSKRWKRIVLFYHSKKQLLNF